MANNWSMILLNHLIDYAIRYVNKGQFNKIVNSKIYDEAGLVEQAHQINMIILIINKCVEI